MIDQYGYAGKILRVDLSSGRVVSTPTSDYAARFLGGRGLAARIYWEEVPPQTGAFDPENTLIFVTGPLAGFNTIGSPRWQAYGKSPATVPEQFNYCNLGGSWGVFLKFAGYDALVVQGQSDRPVYLLIEDDAVQIKDASALWGKTTWQTRDTLKAEMGSSARVVACGPAGENLVGFASFLADNDASGTSGLGAVMGSKRLKAIAVRGSGKVTAAHPERLQDLTKYFRELLKGGGRYEGASGDGVPGGKVKKEACYGCIGACCRGTYQAKDGTKGKFMCGAGLMYFERARRYYGETNEVPFFATKLCDIYGVDALSIDAMTMWLSRCYKAGILTDQSTGIPLSKIGSLDFVEGLVKKVALREGFGDILAQGTAKAAGQLGAEASELLRDYVSKAGHVTNYDPRLYIVHSLLYAMEPRQPIQQLHEVGTVLHDWLDWMAKHEGAYVSSDLFRQVARKFWGGELAADFSTYEGKALATKKIQDRQYAKESLILCDFMWPIVHVRNPLDHMGDSSLDSKLLSAVTGWEVDEEELYRMGERAFNLQRAVLAREGHRGRGSDRLPPALYTMPLKTSFPFRNPELLAPGTDGEVISRKGAVVEEEKFEQMKDEYYELRGWDVASGLQTRSKLEELGLGDVAQDLTQRGLVA